MRSAVLSLVVSCCLATTSLRAATNLLSPDEIPPLRPPRAELPPTFWERYGPWPAIGGSVVLLLSGAGIWLLLRPKTPRPVAPIAQARADLTTLQGQPETGPLLSRISQIVRRYFAGAFGLPPAELTTAEFSQALAGDEQVGPELATQVSELLRQCDLRKFAPMPPSAPLGAATTAAKLIEQAEGRRAAVAQVKGQIETVRLGGSR